jgi:hypothetical protein
MDTKRDFSIRAYRDGDEEGMYALWKIVYPLERRTCNEWKKWWHWMYKENPAGDGLFWLAETNGKIIAQHGQIPIRYKIGDEIVLGSWGMDAMTHPDFRRLGIFETIGDILLKEADRIGIEIGTGFPSQYSHPGFVKKLGWFDVSSVPIEVLPLNWTNTFNTKIKNRAISALLSFVSQTIHKCVYYRALKSSSSSSIVITRIPAFDERVNLLWSKVSKKNKIMIVKDKDYLNWRYQIPGRQYIIMIAEKDHEVQGYIVLKLGEFNELRVCIVCDMIAESEEVMLQLITEAVVFSKKENVDLVRYGFIANRVYHNVLRQKGFISLPFIKAGYWCIYSRSTRIKESFIKDSQNWLVQGADSDVL